MLSITKLEAGNRFRVDLRRRTLRPMVDDVYSTREASRILRVSMRRVHQLLETGGLEGHKDGAGRWQIPQRGVHAMLADRPARNGGDDRFQDPDNTAQEAAELRDRVEGLQRELGRLEGRLELTEVAESTLREQLQRERDRADQLEAELKEERGKGFWRRLFGG